MSEHTPQGTGGVPPGVLTLDDYEALARERLDAPAWAYLSGGAGDEQTLRDNRAAFERRRLQTRVLADLRGGHTRRTLFGRTLELPLLLAPVALQSLAHPDAENASALAAAAMGSGLVLSTESSLRLEDVALQLQRAGAAPASLWFQLYIQPDRAFTADLVRRAEAAGVGALVLTVDAPVRGPRHREQRAGWPLPGAPRPANLAGMAAPAPQVARAGEPALFGTPLLEYAPRWEDLAWLRSLTRLPLLLKGVLSPHDVEPALAHGVDGLVVSNHGGRVLDGVPASLDALPAVAAAVRGRVPLLMDGGIRRGSDVLKALALGADAVLLGRPYVHALAVAGVHGVVHALHLLRAELEVAMALTGCRTLDGIGPEVLWPGPQATG